MTHIMDNQRSNVEKMDIVFHNNVIKQMIDSHRRKSTTLCSFYV